MLAPRRTSSSMFAISMMVLDEATKEEVLREAKDLAEEADFPVVEELEDDSLQRHRIRDAAIPRRPISRWWWLQSKSF